MSATECRSDVPDGCCPHPVSIINAEFSGSFVSDADISVCCRCGRSIVRYKYYDQYVGKGEHGPWVRRMTPPTPNR